MILCTFTVPSRVQTAHRKLQLANRKTTMQTHHTTRLVTACVLIIGAWLGVDHHDSIAQVRSQQPVVIPRLEGDIVLDGLSDEPAWDAVDPLPLTVYQPVYKGEPTQDTEIRIAYNGDYVYVSGRMYDSDPGGIRGNSLYRDEYNGDDIFSVILDTFNDNENMLWFATTPTGVRFDWAVANDAETSGGNFRGAINRSWNTFWDVATEVTDEGWFAEMRIPFSSLRFQDDDGNVVMGLSSYRFIARLNERHMYPDTPPNWSLGWAKASMAQDVTFSGVYSKKPVYITPYVTGGSTFINDLNDDETAYFSNTDFTREAGLDVKYNLTSNLTMDLTVNTDFAQVEADDQQVNLTRLSLFFPEKRQFFQERAGIFEFGTGRVDRLFYSRRIGLDSDGNAVRILGGARVVGRIGAWDLGLLDMQTASNNDLAAENFGVLRIRRQVINPLSYAGAMMTSRLGNDGAYNIAFGVDAIIRPFGDDFVTVRLASTVDDTVVLPNDELETPQKNNLIDASVFRMQWERRTSNGLSYRYTTKRYGPTFNPEMGFVTREDIWANGGMLGFGWFGGEDNWYRAIESEVSGVLITRNQDASVETGNFGVEIQAETKRGTDLSLEAEISYEDLLETEDFPEDTFVPAGSYRFFGVEFAQRSSNANLFSVDTEAFAGSFYDGWRVDLGFGPEWTLSSHLSFEAEYELNMVRFPDRDQEFNAHVVRFRSSMALNTQVSLSAFIQFSSAADLVSTNVRFRYNFKEGNDLWLVYNEGTNLDRHREFNNDRNRPIIPRIDNRIVLLKYTYTFGG